MAKPVFSVKEGRVVLMLALGLCVSGCARFMRVKIDVVQPTGMTYVKKTMTDDGVKVALVLSGGASRGLAHIGVIKVLQEENIQVDMIVGTSIGAVIGAMYAAGMHAQDIEAFARQAVSKSFRLLDMSLFTKAQYGLLDLSPFQKILLKNLPYELIEEYPVNFAAVATDLNTAEQVVFSSGKMGTALSATTAVPGIFSPVFYGDHCLVDGGLVNNLPADVAQQMGADFIIAVNVMRELKEFNPDSYYDVLSGSLRVIINKSGKPNEQLADVLISPEIQEFRAFDFSSENMDVMVQAGEAATREKLSIIKQALGQIRMKKVTQNMEMEPDR